LHWLLVAQLIIIICSKNISAMIPDRSFIEYADSLFNSDSSGQKTYVKIVHNVHKYFLVTTCTTIPVPYSNVIKSLEDINSYKDYFKFMKRSEFVSAESLGDSIALFEAGIALYISWYAGKISQRFSSDRTECRLICGNIDQRVFKDEWEGKITGFIKIRSHDVYMEWRIRDEGDRKTKISLTVAQAPVVYIPKWLLRIAAKNIFPGMLRELEEVLVEKNQQAEISKKNVY